MLIICLPYVKKCKNFLQVLATYLCTCPVFTTMLLREGCTFVCFFVVKFTQVIHGVTTAYSHQAGKRQILFATV